MQKIIKCDTPNGNLNVTKIAVYGPKMDAINRQSDKNTNQGI